MEKTQVSSQASSHGEIADISNAILYFGSFELGKDGNLEPRTPAASQTNNAAAAPTTPAEDAANASNSKKIKNLCPVVEKASEKTQNLPEKSVPGNGSIWGYNFFISREQELAWNESLKNLQDFKERHTNLPKQDYPSTSENIFLENSSPKLNSFHVDWDNEELSDFTSSWIHSGADYAMSSAATKPIIFNLSLLHEILDNGDYYEISMVLVAFKGSYCDLLTDKYLSFIFQRLINVCRDNHLHLVIEDFLSCSHFFINAAFCRIGSNSIIRLIKRLKKSSHALSIVQILSTQFFPIMTDEIAKSVILRCFIYFPNLHNKILYEKAILYCQALAADRVGCRSLNEIIKTICGEQRSKLLNAIAYSSAYLSNHEYGNYVVQNVLSLKNECIIARIVICLQGQFVELALHQGGSHVVEKCIEASDFGMVSVVEEILETPQASFNLATDQFGNYVIQRALKKAKEKGFRDLYESLLKSLEPYSKELNLSMCGKIVLGLIKTLDSNREERNMGIGKWRGRRRNWCCNGRC